MNKFVLAVAKVLLLLLLTSTDFTAFAVPNPTTIRRNTSAPYVPEKDSAMVAAPRREQLHKEESG